MNSQSKYSQVRKIFISTTRDAWCTQNELFEKTHVYFLSSFLAPNTQWNPPYWWLFSLLNPHPAIIQYLFFYQKLPQIFLKRWSIKPLIHRNPLSSLNEKGSADFIWHWKDTAIDLESSLHVSKSDLLWKSPSFYRSVSPSYAKFLFTPLASIKVKL